MKSVTVVVDVVRRAVERTLPDDRDPPAGPPERTRDRRRERDWRELRPRRYPYASGCGHPLHLHTRYEERVWVLAGGLLARCADERIELGPGSFYLIPRESPHVIRSASGARALVSSSPAAFADLLIRGGVPAVDGVAVGAFDPELFERISIELGDQILEPPGTESSTGDSAESVDGGSR